MPAGHSLDTLIPGYSASALERALRTTLRSLKACFAAFASLRHRGTRVGVGAVLLLAALPAHAVQPDEVLKDPTLESRARTISEGLRCLVCQNQSIDDSDAPLARDLRVIVRERLQAGDTNPQVVDYVVGRYGEFVLLKPVFGWHTLLLWLSPLLAVGLGAFGIWRLSRRRAPEPAAGLTVAEQAEVDGLLGRK